MQFTVLTVALLAAGLIGCKKPGADPGTQRGAPGPQSAATLQPAPVTTAPDRAAAQRENTQGMKSYKTKNYAAAAEKFRHAVAADAGFPLPRYNLACVAALTGDKETARAQLQWLADSPDPQARRTLAKAVHDQDLKSLAEDPKVRSIIHWGAVFGGYHPLALEADATEKEAAQLANSAPQVDPDCDSEPAFTVARSLSADFVAEQPGKELLVVSMAHGAAIFNGAAELLARGGSFACVGSQSGILDVSAGQLVPDVEPELVVHYLSGGRQSQAEGIDVYKRRGSELINILSVSLPDSGAAKASPDDPELAESGWLSVDSDGTILTSRPGEKMPQRQRWDAGKFAFVPVAVSAAAGGPVASCTGAWVLQTAPATECIQKELKFLLVQDAKGAYEVRGREGKNLTLGKTTVEGQTCNVELKLRSTPLAYGDDDRAYCKFQLTETGGSARGSGEAKYKPSQSARYEGLRSKSTLFTLQGTRRPLQPADTIIDREALAKQVTELVSYCVVNSCISTKKKWHAGDRVEVVVELDRSGLAVALSVSGDRQELTDTGMAPDGWAQLYNPTGRAQKLTFTIDWPK